MVNKQSAAVTGKIWGKTNPEIVEKLRDRTLNKDSRPDSEIYNKDQKERFYANEKAYEDLEIKELEIIVGGWKWSDWNRRYNLEGTNLFRWGNFGHGLLNYLIRNPLIQREAIEYIQEGVGELALNDDLKVQLNKLLIKKKDYLKPEVHFLILEIVVVELFLLVIIKSLWNNFQKFYHQQNQNH